MRVALLFLLLTVFAALQLAWLDYPILSGDEAIGPVIIREEIARFFATGAAPSLNPVVPYIGPIDGWAATASVALATRLLGLDPQPWMIRVIPLLLFWIASVALVREVARASARKAKTLLVILAFTPMAFVSSRIAWSPATSLGLVTLLVHEVLRMRRTGQARWLVIGALGGLAFCIYPVTAFATLAALATEWRPLAAGMKRRPGRLAAGLALALAISWPVLRNLPPPVAGEGMAASSPLWELRAFLNIVSGERPLRFLFGRDPTPIALLVPQILGFLALLLFSLQDRARRPGPERRWLIATLAATAIMAVFCYRGRRLDLTGNERYLVPLIPAWLLLISDAVDRAAERWKLSLGAVNSLLLAFSVLGLGRLVISVPRGHPDPARLAAHWLQDRCPRESCVAYAENYWLYWPLRYYSLDRVNLNTVGHNWKNPERHPARARAASCWFTDSKEPYRGRYVAKEEWGTVVCYDGVESLSSGPPVTRRSPEEPPRAAALVLRHESAPSGPGRL